MLLSEIRSRFRGQLCVKVTSTLFFAVFNAYLNVRPKQPRTERKFKKTFLEMCVDRGLVWVSAEAMICVKLMGLHGSEIS